MPLFLDVLFKNDAPVWTRCLDSRQEIKNRRKRFPPPMRRGAGLNIQRAA
jgi:hypothetical protein